MHHAFGKHEAGPKMPLRPGEQREAARLLFRQDRIAEAIPYFEKATQLVDADWHNAGMLTTCYHEVADSEKLRRAAQMTAERVEKALAKDPSNASALASGAGALAILGEHQKAKDWIERALLLDPDNILMRYNLACALAKDLNDNDRAIEVLRPYFERTVSTAQLRHAAVDTDLDPDQRERRNRAVVDFDIVDVPADFRSVAVVLSEAEADADGLIGVQRRIRRQVRP